VLGSSRYAPAGGCEALIRSRRAASAQAPEALLKMAFYQAAGVGARNRTEADHLHPVRAAWSPRSGKVQDLLRSQPPRPAGSDVTTIKPDPQGQRRDRTRVRCYDAGDRPCRCTFEVVQWARTRARNPLMADAGKRMRTRTNIKVTHGRVVPGRTNGQGCHGHRSRPTRMRKRLLITSTARRSCSTGRSAFRATRSG
jgi:hypothetical protein